MDLEGRKNNIYYDKKGVQILQGDLLKVYHYGSKNRTKYMYHVVVMDEKYDFPVLSGKDYFSQKPHYKLFVMCDNKKRIYQTAEIIYKYDYETKRERINANQTNTINSSEDIQITTSAQNKRNDIERSC